MNQLTTRGYLAKTVSILAFFVSFAAISAKAGGDGYEIYLNNKLILKQYKGQSLSLTSLELNASNAKDQLVIYYTSCNAKDNSGKNRSITLKDRNGNTLKVWTFADMKDNNGAMIIPVKEILDLEKKNAESNLTIFYASQDHPQTQILSSLQLSVKNAG
ncbi:MAG: hypothetical protein ACHQEM_08415 [Chitinophagales bacterium]